MRFGFEWTDEYDKYYPGAVGKYDESFNILAYSKELYKSLGAVAIRRLLYDADSIDAGSGSNHSRIKTVRIMLRDLYLEPYENDDPENLFIFPKVDEIKEEFCYNNVGPINNFWFCTDWKG